MRYPDRRQSRPLDGWDPYGGDRAPRKRRFAPRRLLRIVVPLFVALAPAAHDLWREIVPDRPAAAPRSAPVAQPLFAADRPLPPDPRTALPRGPRPASDPGSWFTPDDYPAAALRETRAGTTYFRFVILPDGHVRDCTVTRSSGSVILDGAACNVFDLHARYWPARDRTGAPIATTGRESVRWQIPDQ
jgi:TonB family protein